jgi:hypothetical protein
MKPRVNDRPFLGRFGFPALGRKADRKSVDPALNLQPVARHPVGVASIFAPLALCLLLIGYNGCRAAPAPAPVDDPPRAERDYQRVIRDLEGRPFLRITCRYVGKRPDGELAQDLPWQAIDVDFYHLVFENLTAERIGLISQRAYQLYDQPWEWQTSRKGEETRVYKTTPEPASIDFKRHPGLFSEVLYPRSSLQKRNRYYHTNNQLPYNRLTLQTRLKYMGVEYRINYYLIYRK